MQTHTWGHLTLYPTLETGFLKCVQNVFVFLRNGGIFNFICIFRKIWGSGWSLEWMFLVLSGMEIISLKCAEELFSINDNLITLRLRNSYGALRHCVERSIIWLLILFFYFILKQALDGYSCGYAFYLIKNKSTMNLRLWYVLK